MTSEGKIVRIFPRASATGRPAVRGRGVSGSDADLLSRVGRGDTAAHRALFDRYYARVMAFVRRRLHDDGLCEEVASDVFFEVWRSAPRFRGESEVYSWIFGIAHFKVLSARRHAGQRKRASVVPTGAAVLSRFADGEDAGELLESRQEVQRLLRAIQKLPSGQREVLRLAFLEGMGYREIALELGLSEGNVKTRVNRARARLRALVSRDPAEDGS